MIWKTFKWLLILSLVCLIGFGATLLYYSNSSQQFKERIQLPLPPQIGGTIGINVEGLVVPQLFEQQLSAQITLSFQQEQLNEILPIGVYSLLQPQVDSKTVDSLLGRLSLVADSAEIRFAGNKLTFHTLFEGDFFIRERVEVEDDQPNAGEQVPVSGEIFADLFSPQITEEWKLQFASYQVSIGMDTKTVRELSGRFGPGYSFLVLLEDLLNKRVKVKANNFLLAGQDLRLPLQARLNEFLERKKGKWWHPWLIKIQIEHVKVDRCPRMVSGKLTMGFEFLAEYHATSDSIISLPNLQLRNDNCDSS